MISREVRTPGQYDANAIQAKYYAMIAQIDDQLGRILETLDETGQRGNTVIIFTSDHGEMLGDHGLMFKGCRFYEGLVDALDRHFTGGSGTFATMYRDTRYKLSIYHDREFGELYDLTEDPWEFNDLWNEPAFAEIKHRLIYESFNAHVTLTTQVGSERIAPM